MKAIKNLHILAILVSVVCSSCAPPSSFTPFDVGLARPEGSRLLLTYAKWTDEAKTEIIGVGVGCLDENILCLGEPEVLIELNYLVSWYAWSPNGEKLAFSGNKLNETDQEVFVVQRDGRNLKRLTNNNIDEWNIVWSPDGSQIAYTRCLSYLACNSEIRINDFKKERVLSISGSDILGIKNIFSWTRGKNESYLFTASSDDGIFQIFSLAVNVELANQLTTGQYEPYSPSISPNGVDIAFSRSLSLIDNDIIVINLETGEEVSVTSGPEMDISPAWSPDGNWIAFSSGSSLVDIYLVNVLTKETVNVTRNPGLLWSPAWLWFVTD